MPKRSSKEEPSTLNNVWVDPSREEDRLPAVVRERRQKERARVRPPSDPNKAAASILEQVTDETEIVPEKNPAAQALGRLGGLKGGKARAAALTPEERKATAQKAAEARWRKTKS